MKHLFGDRLQLLLVAPRLDHFFKSGFLEHGIACAKTRFSYT